MLKNQELAGRIIEMMDTLVEGLELLVDYLDQTMLPFADGLIHDLGQCYERIESISKQAYEEEPSWNFPAAARSCMVSLERIRLMTGVNPERASRKAEFELLPLTEEMRGNFYYWMIVNPDPERLKRYYESERESYFYNRYLEEALRTGEYPYELSIRVIGYNKLDYTSLCVEGLLSHLPEGVSYELIFVNHGSRDSTKEYFESKHPHKQMDIAVNGGGLGASDRILEGRYSISICNDVVVTENAIRNLYDCIKSDPQIAWAVPTTSNVSNLQALPLFYQTLDEMQIIAAKNNKPDPFRWEQRVRLINPVQIYSMELFHKMGFSGDYRFYSFLAFPDDKMSLIWRRNGYKMMLVKNAYCHHFGQVTLKDDLRQEQEQKVYDRGRINFKKVYGIDPWDSSFCYEKRLFKRLPCDRQGHVDILGVNCGLGSNSLKIKEQIKEISHNFDVSLRNLTDEACFLPDLWGISDEASWCDDLEGEIVKDGGGYDYIIMDRNLENYRDYQKLIQSLYDHLKAGGWIMVRTYDQERLEWVKSHYENVSVFQDSPELRLKPVYSWSLWMKR